MQMSEPNSKQVAPGIPDLIPAAMRALRSPTTIAFSIVIALIGLPTVIDPMGSFAFRFGWHLFKGTNLVIFLVLTGAVSLLLQGALIYISRDVLLGQPAPIGAAFRAFFGSLWRLLYPLRILIAGASGIAIVLGGVAYAAAYITDDTTLTIRIVSIFGLTILAAALPLFYLYIRATYYDYSARRAAADPTKLVEMTRLVSRSSGGYSRGAGLGQYFVEYSYYEPYGEKDRMLDRAWDAINQNRLIALAVFAGSIALDVCKGPLMRMVNDMLPIQSSWIYLGGLLFSALAVAFQTMMWTFLYLIRPGQKKE